MNSPDRIVERLTRWTPRAAEGWARRVENDVVHDVAAFVFLDPSRWRVRHRDGDELITDRGRWWRRSSRAESWDYQEDRAAEDIHHSGWLRSLLFPRLLPAVSDPASQVLGRERLPDGTTRLRLAHVEPVPGVVLLDVSAAGYVARLAGRDGEVSIVLEMVADLDAQPDPVVFDPGRPWDPGPPPWHP